VFDDRPLTKRQLGWLSLAAGLALALATLAADLVGAGQFDGFGPAQRQALAAGGLLVAFGLSLLPLGHRPA
jgi:Na+-driven multidrug efflux pump